MNKLNTNTRSFAIALPAKYLDRYGDKKNEILRYAENIGLTVTRNPEYNPYNLGPNGFILIGTGEHITGTDIIGANNITELAYTGTYPVLDLVKDEREIKIRLMNYLRNSNDARTTATGCQFYSKKTESNAVVEIDMETVIRETNDYIRVGYNIIPKRSVHKTPQTTIRVVHIK